MKRQFDLSRVFLYTVTFNIHESNTGDKYSYVVQYYLSKPVDNEKGMFASEFMHTDKPLKCTNRALNERQYGLKPDFIGGLAFQKSVTLLSDVIGGLAFQTSVNIIKKNCYYPSSQSKEH